MTGPAPGLLAFVIVPGFFGTTALDDGPAPPPLFCNLQFDTVKFYENLYMYLFLDTIHEIHENCHSVSIYFMIYIYIYIYIYEYIFKVLWKSIGCNRS